MIWIFVKNMLIMLLYFSSKRILSTNLFICITIIWNKFKYFCFIQINQVDRVLYESHKFHENIYEIKLYN